MVTFRTILFGLDIGAQGLVLLWIKDTAGYGIGWLLEYNMDWEICDWIGWNRRFQG